MVFVFIKDASVGAMYGQFNSFKMQAICNVRMLMNIDIDSWN
jgi:hypothetical protein